MPRRAAPRHLPRSAPPLGPPGPRPRRARPASWALLLGLGACGQDYTVKDIESPSAGSDTARPTEPGADEQSTLARTCPAADGLPTEVGLIEGCAHEIVTGSIEAIVEWEIPRWSNYGEYSQVVMAPVVGQLDDDNGDGQVTRDDTPDIALVTDDEGLAAHKKGILRVVPGDGLSAGRALSRLDVEVGGQVWQVYPYRYSNLAIGDVDNDGEAEIVAIVQVVEGEGGGEEGGGEMGGEEGGGSGDTAPPGEGGGGEEGGDPGGGDEGGAGGGEIPISLEPIEGGGGELPASQLCVVAAFKPDLTTVAWLSLEATLPCGGHAPALGDLEGDGDVEVIVGDLVLEGAGGAVRSVGGAGVGAYRWHPEVGYQAVPVDLDGDGLMEVVTGRTLYDSGGGVRCDHGSDEHDGFVGVADLDLDGQGEVVSVGGGRARVFEADCAVTAEWVLEGTGNGGSPTIADFDADGAPEIGISSGTFYAVYEPDGTLLWAAPVQDESSASTGSAVYDFEGDGRPEVVYADETRLWIYAGGTGEVRYVSDKHASRTLHELPTVADVDGDGLVEVIVPNGGGHQGEDRTGLWILGSANGDWLPGRQTWSQHAWHLTHIDDDLQIPAAPMPNWPLHNNFRSGDPQPVSGGDAPDASPLAELCLDECELGRLVVRVRVGNGGAAPMRRDVPVSLYAEDIAGYRTFLGSAWSLAEVDPGETTDVITLTLDWAGYQGQSLVVVADDDAGQGWVPECVEDNNELRFEAPACP